VSLSLFFRFINKESSSVGGWSVSSLDLSQNLRKKIQETAFAHEMEIPLPTALHVQNKVAVKVQPFEPENASPTIMLTVFFPLKITNHTERVLHLRNTEEILSIKPGDTLPYRLSSSEAEFAESLQFALSVNESDLVWASTTLNPFGQGQSLLQFLHMSGTKS
jgi:hypothetical protein